MILKINKRNYSTLLIAGMLLNAPLLALEDSHPLRPNVVFILADDLGWMDLGCYGSTFYDTPNIDALAERGLRFTQAYMASPLCAPARSSIMTGLDPARTGMTYPDIGRQVVNLEKRLQASAPKNAPRLLPEPVTVLSTEYYTMGMAFRKAGYAMGHYGKWHLGRSPYSPLQHGFDIDIPHTNVPGPLLHGFFHPFPIWPDRGEPGDHLEDLLADEAVRFIRANKDRPFFLNYWAFQVHSPWEAKPEQIEKYEARAEPGALQRNPVYAGMVESLDDAVGNLVEALEEAGILDRTIIIFVSDNGPFIAAHPSPVMLAGYEDVPVTSVLPFRGGKMTVYEGGIRVPLIMLWPGLTEAGTLTSELVHSNDFFPSFIDLLGLPSGDAPVFDGVSFRSILEGGKAARDEIFCYFPHNQDTRPYDGMRLPTSSTPAASLRKGDWKLIRFFADQPDGSDRYELYNLAVDPGELHNKTNAEPARFSELREILENHLQNTGAIIPQRNPAYTKN